ncbi:MAG: orotidine-5'-phosphate decarboxylase [Tenacibaculum sp.]
MTTQQLVHEIKKKKSFLCIGLDVDIQKIPEHLLKQKNPIFAFNKAVIDATHHLCVAYKLNTAFYEAYGFKGWEALEMTIAYIKQHYPKIFSIADAKRGDIGNTSTMYAKAFFHYLSFDSLTVVPYMGKDSVEPFLAFKNKYTILLALTSNRGAFDFQTKKIGKQELFKWVLQTSKKWKNSENLMYVVGATKAKFLSTIRNIVPNNFLLIPGVGKQGGNLKAVCKYGMNKQVGLLVNSSRSIIYVSKGVDFDKAVTKKALKLQMQMQDILQQNAFL